MKRQHNQFARRVTRKGNSPGSMGDADDKRHAGQGTFDPTLQRHHGHRSLIVFPKQHVMFKENRVALSEVELRGRNDLAFYLAGAQPKMNLGHVSDARGFTPSGFTHEILYIQRCATRPARKGSLLIYSLAPFTSDAFNGFGCRRSGCDARCLRFYGRAHWCLILLWWGTVSNQFGSVKATKSFSISKRSTTVWTVFHDDFDSSLLDEPVHITTVGSLSSSALWSATACRRFVTTLLNQKGTAVTK